MANCIDYNCSDLEDHVKNDCEDERQGGSDQMIILDCDHQLTDPSSAAEINAEIAAGRAKLVQNIKLGWDVPTAVTVDSNIAGRTPKVVNYDRTGQIMDGNVNQFTNTFWDSLNNGRAVGGMIVYESGNGGDKVTWIDAAIQFQGGRTLPNTDTEFQRYEETFTWRSLTEPAIYDSPTGIFS